MQKHYWLLAFAATVLAALAMSEDTDAQPGKKGPFGKKGDFPRGVSAEQIVERILSYDKNNDGKVTADELPERMQHLIALGDVNKDGALDRDEITKLATTLESFAGLTGGNGGPKGPPPGGFDKGPPQKGPPQKGGGLKGIANEVERALDELNVAGSERAKADRAIRAHQDKMRRIEELARAELLLQMKDALKEDDYKVLKSALDRPPPGPGGPGKGPKGPPRPVDMKARIDQLQKELEELRTKVENQK